MSSLAWCPTERSGTKKENRRKVFCQITQHLLENHELWKRVIAADVEEVEPQKEDPNGIGSPADPITAIHEEEEDQESKEEELTDCLDERDEEEVLPQSETLGEKDEEPE